MKTRDIVTGFIVLVVLIGGVLLYKNMKDKNQPATTPTPSVEERISETFNGVTLSEDTERVELKDISGGDGIGLATRTEILVDLPEPPSGQYYQAKLTNDDDKSVLLGTLRVAKGGFMIEYDSSKYPGYNKVSVILGDKTLLEGSF